MDVILAPCEEFSFALVGWIGSRTYLRFMRAHAKDLGMFLNSHRCGRGVLGSCCVDMLPEVPLFAAETAFK
jgi:hypothetical protein